MGEYGTGPGAEVVSNPVTEQYREHTHPVHLLPNTRTLVTLDRFDECPTFGHGNVNLFMLVRIVPTADTSADEVRATLSIAASLEGFLAKFAPVGQAGTTIVFNPSVAAERTLYFPVLVQPYVVATTVSPILEFTFQSAQPTGTRFLAKTQGVIGVGSPPGYPYRWRGTAVGDPAETYRKDTE